MDVHGAVVEKDGVEYRVLLREDLRGMRHKNKDGEEDDGFVAGFWVAPVPGMEWLGVPLFDITKDIHHPTIMQDVAPVPMPMPPLGILAEAEDLPCPHGRPAANICPHCNGTNEIAAREESNEDTE
jgi:hypothetical protein